MNDKFLVRMQNISDLDSFNTSNHLIEAQFDSNETHTSITHFSFDIPLEQKFMVYDVDSSSANLKNNSELTIPLSVLKNNSSLQSIVFYLHEIHNLNFADIARLLNRNQRTIWATYTQAKAKKKILLPKFDEKVDYTFAIPLSILSSRNLSVLESIVFYLKLNSNLSLAQIAQKLGKNYRTIWTVNRRAKLKLDISWAQSKRNIMKNG